MVLRNLRIRATKLKEAAWKTPILEYTCSVWDPYFKKNIDMLENVQRRAARFVLRNHHSHSSVTAMFDRLCWPTLQQRRKLARLVSMLYKMLHDNVRVVRSKLIPAAAHQRRGHSQQLFLILTQYRQSSFLPNTIRDWNDLPETTVSASTLGSSTARVPSLRK